ncbi:hypothetical protein CRU79_25005 [Escherichia sp. E4385]|uniref:hypothetical protein n=1 Tax=Escherichia sp. E4385 TaxID=2040639 RepID=UPI00107F2FEA|nr:hypothetical protein [Escherichia sp. E4385]TGC12215.1 hypothetical protein CRU79_25005 [Escherichia sp. E4385]
MSLYVINTTYQKIEKDGLTMTISQRKGPESATIYSTDGSNLENNPVKKSPFKYHVNVITKNDWALLDYDPILITSYEGDAKKITTG